MGTHLAASTYNGKADNVVLLGPHGVGKNNLAVALGHKPLEAGYIPQFDSAVGWLSQPQAAHAGAAITDRLVPHAEALTLGGQPYRTNARRDLMAANQQPEGSRLEASFRGQFPPAIDHDTG